MEKRCTTESDWALHARMYAFLGNSLLAPMRLDASCGLSEEFWGSFERDGTNERARGGIAKLKAYARGVAGKAREDAVRAVSVEFARLFIGPPKPLAPPWESMAKGSPVGFGEPTSNMRAVLREAGLVLDGPSNQYDDHMGVELLYLSVMCDRFSQKAPSMDEEIELRTFIAERPLGWIPLFYEAVRKAAPGGYYEGLVELTWGLLAAEV